MQEFDIPNFKKAYSIYREFYSIRKTVSKQDRYTIYLRTENAIIGVIEGVLLAGQQSKLQKLPTLENVSISLNLIRILIRLMKDVKAIDINKYTNIEEDIDEIGRMLGGWIKSTKEA